MDFARLWEQAKDLWSRPVGKLIIGTVGAFLVIAAAASYMWSRPNYVALGTFDGVVAPQVAKKLNESKIPFKNQNFTFSVAQGDYDQARLVLAELPIDTAAGPWGGFETWKGKTSWSDTEFDKRRLWEEQTANNLSRAIKTLSVVEQARVTISVPTKDPLFKEQETPPKATVVVLPRKGQKLSLPVVESIMELVASAVEKLDRSAVTVIDSSTSKVVSADAFKQKSSVDGTATVSDLQMMVVKQYQDTWTDVLTQRLEKVAGVGNASVLVNPTINWERVMKESVEYTPVGNTGQGVLLSEQNDTRTADGTSPSTSTTPSGTTPNTDTGIPGYPGAPGQKGGTQSEQSAKKIANYLVSQTKTITEKPGGSIEGISVGVFLNTKTIDPAAEAAIKNVVATAMGSKAQVELAAVPFAPGLWDDLTKTPISPVATGTPALLYVLLAVALTLGAVGFGMLAFRPRKPVLEPVFAGPEAAMMGGIPVADLEMQSAADAYGAHNGGGLGGTTAAARLEGALADADTDPLAPEEMALLGDEFLQKLGVDPAKVRMRERVEKIAKANPEAVANLLKTWISDG